MVSVHFHLRSDPSRPFMNDSAESYIYKNQKWYLLHFDVIVPKDLLSPKHFGPERGRGEEI